MNSLTQRNVGGGYDVVPKLALIDHKDEGVFVPALQGRPDAYGRRGGRSHLNAGYNERRITRIRQKTPDIGVFAQVV